MERIKILQIQRMIREVGSGFNLIDCDINDDNDFDDISKPDATRGVKCAGWGIN